MPYIRRERRREIQKGYDPEDMGELTYVLYKAAARYLGRHGESFQTHGEILGALDAVGKEWYRRRVGPYEDRKIEENGDVH